MILSMKGITDTKEELTALFQKKILDAVNFCLAQMQQEAEGDMTGYYHSTLYPPPHPVYCSHIQNASRFDFALANISKRWAVQVYGV
jgi:hypothetical protein